MRALVALIAFFSWPVLAQRLELYADLNPLCQGAGCSGVQPSDYATGQGSTIYFAANDGFTGFELWRTDGTTMGTTLVADLTPGPAGSVPNQFFAVGGLVYFVADDGQAGFELWRTDGTAMGTVRLSDVLPGTSSGFVGYVGPLGQRLVFSANGGDGPEPWVTDGTAAGTQKLADLTLAVGGSSPSAGVEVNGTLYFIATNGMGDRVIFRTTGTGAQETVLRLMCDPVRLFGVGTTNTAFYFNTNCGQLWRFDGVIPTLVGAYAVRDVVRLGTETFYLGSGPTTFGLHKIDPTFFVPQRLDFDDGFTGEPSTLTVIGNRLAFLKVGAGGLGRVWASDGTAMGTQPVALFSNDGVTAPTPRGVRVGQRLVWTGAIDATTPAVFSSDLTDAGTKVVWQATNSLATVSTLVSSDAGLMFFANDGRLGLEPYFSDGISSRLLRDISLVNESSDPAGFVDVDGGTLFSALTPDLGRELFLFTGVDGGVRLVSDARSGPLSGSPRDLVVTPSGRNYLKGDDGAGAAVYELQGTTARRLAEVKPDASMVSLLGDGVAFTFDSPETGPELAVISPAGTAVRVLELIAGVNGAAPGSLTPVDGGVLFAASAVGGRELWFSSGTDAGLQRIDDICPGSCSSDPLVLGETPYGYLVSATSPMGGREPWLVTVGQLPTLLADINVQGDSSPLRLLVMPGGAYFTAVRPAEGRELWVTDGTTGGTRLVSDVAPGVPGSDPQQLTRLDEGRLIFSAATDFEGRELWVTDGTTTGTRLLADAWPGARGSEPQVLAVRRGVAFVSMESPERGREVWSTDGTQTGTRLLADLLPGDAGSSPSEARWVGNGLVVAARAPLAGRELLRVSDVTPPTIRSFVLGPQGDDGWFVGDVEVRFQVEEDGFFFERQSGCSRFVIQSDTPDGSVQCEAVSPGGATVETVRYRRDTVPPRMPTMLSPSDGGDVSALATVEAVGSTEPNLRVGLVVGEGQVCSTTSQADGGFRCSFGTSGLDAGFLPLVAEVKDSAGNAARSAVVFIRMTRADTTAPRLTCPNAQFLTEGADGGVVATYVLRAIDETDPAPLLEAMPPSGSRFAIGVTPVRVTATDSAGNRSMCMFDITVSARPPDADGGMARPVGPAQRGCGCGMTEGQALLVSLVFAAGWKRRRRSSSLTR